jgi:hypothetical protein
MAIPKTRDEFKQLILRNLGYPILEINITDDQIDDQIDYSLKMFADYHFDGSDKVYYKYPIAANNRPDRIWSIRVANGGVGYTNTDVVVIANTYGSNATATIVTAPDGTIQSVNITNPGQNYPVAPAVTVTTSTGSDADLRAELGGFIPVPDNIMGVVNIFDVSSMYNSTDSLFNARYQLVMSDVYSLQNSSLVPYYMTMSHIALLDQLLVGKQPIRYNRHKNKLYLDMDWPAVNDGQWIIAEAYEVLDPNEYTDVWGDRWLNQYCTERIKKLTGTILKKFPGMALPGGIQFNGQQMWDEANAAIEELEHELINSYSLPAMDMIG